MKVKTALQLAEIIDKSLPSDMKNLKDAKYYSAAQDKFIPIEDMDMVHLIRAFKRMIGLDSRMMTQEARSEYVRRDVYEMLFDKCEKLEERIKSEYVSQIPSSVPTATFNYIPNNSIGQTLVDYMKKYLNKERYTLKDRGQCINREKYPLEEVSTDRGIDKKEYGKFLKVHINEKRRSK